MKNYAICLIVTLAFGLHNSVLADNSKKPSVGKCKLTIPGHESSQDLRHQYPKKLLLRLLKVTEQAYGPCDITEVSVSSQKRIIEGLKETRIDVAWLPAHSALKDQLLPLEIPIRKGLLGWRLLLIRSEDQEKFSRIQSLADFKGMRPGFGFDWQDLPVMKSAFGKVVTGVEYENLFSMLQERRFDFLSRAIHEAWTEIELRRKSHPQLVVENHLALPYKQVDFFYLNKNSQALHKRLFEGFRSIIRSGSFDRLFYATYKDDIERSKMYRRQIIELENPNLPTNVPLEDPQLWIQLKDSGQTPP
ncbi:MAG: hypothetical protein HRU19_01255 [Pseudobacteriovorax sp.]|nr:hypothetical protein [Pseudobacteriovorax sp.]